MRRLVAAAITLIMAVPAYAQKIPPINLLRDKEPDAYTLQRQKEIESEYNATLKKIPDRKKQTADPWQNMRGSVDSAGKQHNKPNSRD